ncbi:aminodeoxychorismate synthase component I [Microbacterium sp. NPDC078428]|uniref:aminodeoxychorismate synthase component I n=1 Tax=Microbacterium sp. NPDC078428 TaxID=3364190 RepID=UPI0037CC547F
MPHDIVAVSLPAGADPARIFAAIEPRHPEVFWLDSGTNAREGFSYVGVGDAVPAEVVHDVALGGSADGGDSGWSVPGRFRGGWIGWFSYESGAHGMGAPAAGPADDRWMRVRRWVAFEHATGRAWAVAPASDAPEWHARMTDAAASPAPEPLPPTGSTEARARHTAEHYAVMIERCRDAIREGDAYQLCLTTRFEAPAADAATVYARLRAGSPAHHGAFVRIGDTALLSASPEEFLAVGDGIVRTRPIKGTRPRAADAAADAALAGDLIASEKERAENVMIVDLMRNDLARVCEPGTVRVDALLAVESYPHVHQLVSTVSGRLRPGVRMRDLLRCAFPAGSMTGAPKLSAMGILHRLEGAPRGVYAGCFGWIGDDGGADLAMVIRSIVLRGETAVVGAGGGITWSSVTADEVREVGIKASAPLRALGARLPSGW